MSFNTIHIKNNESKSFFNLFKRSKQPQGLSFSNFKVKNMCGHNFWAHTFEALFSNFVACILEALIKGENPERNNGFFNF